MVWGEISDRSKFAYDANGDFIPEATTFLMCGERLDYLMCVLNSPIAEWLFSKQGTTTGVGTVRWKKYTIQGLQIPKISTKDEQGIATLVRRFIDNEISEEQLSSMTNRILYNAIGLSAEEVQLVELHRKSYS